MLTWVRSQQGHKCPCLRGFLLPEAGWALLGPEVMAFWPWSNSLCLQVNKGDRHEASPRKKDHAWGTHLVSASLSRHIVETKPQWKLDVLELIKNVEFPERTSCASQV